MTGSVSGQSCEVKERRARFVAGWVTKALEQGQLVALMLGTIGTTMVSEVFDELMQEQLCLLKEKRRGWWSGNGYHRYKRHTYNLAV